MVEIPLEIIKELQVLSSAHPFEEICGIVTSSGEIIPITNSAETNKHRCFLFSKREYFAALRKMHKEGTTIKFVYHSHPGGDCTPSSADIAFILTSKRDSLIVSENNFKYLEYQDA